MHVLHYKRFQTLKFCLAIQGHDSLSSEGFPKDLPGWKLPLGNQIWQREKNVHIHIHPPCTKRFTVSEDGLVHSGKKGFVRCCPWPCLMTRGNWSCHSLSRLINGNRFCKKLAWFRRAKRYGRFLWGTGALATKRCIWTQWFASIIVGIPQSKECKEQIPSIWEWQFTRQKPWDSYQYIPVLEIIPVTSVRKRWPVPNSCALKGTTAQPTMTPRHGNIWTWHLNYLRHNVRTGCLIALTCFEAPYTSWRSNG